MPSTILTKLAAVGAAAAALMLTTATAASAAGTVTVGTHTTGSYGYTAATTPAGLSYTL